MDLLLDCVTLDKLFKLFELQASHLQSEDRYSIFLKGLFWALHEITCVNSLAQCLYLAFKISESIVTTVTFEPLKEDFPS